MTDETQPDGLAAFMAGAGYHVLQAPKSIPEDASESLIAAGCYYAPRLLAAIEAVLALHHPGGVTMDVRPCSQHRTETGACTTYTFAQLRDVRRACPDCTFTERVTCWQGKCREEEWPCTEYQAISAALLTKAE